jgi:Caspase domain
MLTGQKTLLGSLLALCLLCQGLALFNWSGLAAFGQSNDSTNPLPLKNNLITGQVEPGGQNYYWTFAAGPGDVTLSLSGQTDSFSTNSHLVLIDDQGRELIDLTGTATTSGTSRSASLHLTHRQQFKLRLSLGLNVGVQLKYKIQIKGAALEAAKGQSSGASSIPSSPAERDSDDLPSAATTAGSDSSSASTSTDAFNKMTPIEDKWAFVVGVSKFQLPSINLNYPAKDAKDLADYLVKEANFAPDHVKLLVNEQATKERVMAELGDKWLPRLAHPNDLVMIFLSTHGSPSQADIEGLNYLVMYNTDPGSLYATGLPLEDLASAVKHRVHSNRIVLIIDACHSGAANPAPTKGLIRRGNFDSNFLAQGTGQLIICSSEPNQVSWESRRYQNGVFTRQLIEALRSRSGKISLEKAFEKLKESVQSEVLQDRGELQTAVLKSRWQGSDLIISDPPTRPRDIPADLKDQ